MANLSTVYMGLKLRSPLVAAASPISRTVEAIERLEDAGAGAVVLFSLFQEQIVADSGGGLRSRAEIAWSATLQQLPSLSDFRMDPDAYVEHVREAKKAVAIPVIASLNGATPG